MNINKALQNLYHKVSGETTHEVNISKLLCAIHYEITNTESEAKNDWVKIIDSLAVNWPDGHATSHIEYHHIVRALRNLYYAISGETTREVNISKLLVMIHLALTDEYPDIQNNYGEIINSLAENWPAPAVWETESVPYLFRQSGGALNSRLLGKEKDTIVGASVGWNQLVKIPTTDASKTENGVTITDNRDGSFTVSTTAEGATADTTLWLNTFQRKDHKLLMKGCPPNGSLGTYCVSDGWTGSADMGNGKILIGVSNTQLGIKIKSGTIITTAKVFEPQLIDLTLLLGSTIADYIYTLEQGTAGAGVAKLKEWGFFSEPYYAYNQGEIKSVSGLSAHKMVGKNLNPYEGVNYAVNNSRERFFLKSGTYTFSTDTGNQLQSGANYYIRLYDAKTGGNVITDGNITSDRLLLNGDHTLYYGGNGYVTLTFTLLIDAWVCFGFNNIVPTTCNAVQLEFGSTATDYEPYHSDSYALDSSITLRGLFKMDADHNLYADGDTYESSGQVTRKYGVVDLGSLYWGLNTGNRFTAAAINNTAVAEAKEFSNTAIANIVCQKYPATKRDILADKQISLHYSGQNYINIIDTAYSDVDTFKTAMSGVYVVYELATPTTETADAFTNPQSVDKYGTEEYVTANGIPVGHQTQYKVVES